VTLESIDTKATEKGTQEGGGDNKEESDGQAKWKLDMKTPKVDTKWANLFTSNRRTTREYDWLHVYCNESLMVGHRSLAKEKRVALKKPIGEKSCEDFPTLHKGKEVTASKKAKSKSVVKSRTTLKDAGCIETTIGFSMIVDLRHHPNMEVFHGDADYGAV
ncbi:hypothetical protein HAX54_022328, partial [Datura stramonium]|nr:hypothetical protein [Datura stramonium]